MQRLTRLTCLGTISLFAFTGASLAQTPAPFDMKGTWKGTGEAIIDGVTGYHPPGAAGTKPTGNYRLRAVTYTYTIDGQDGRRFWGSVSSDSVANERLIGSFAVDGKSIYMVGREGFLDGHVVDSDTIQMCYRQITASSAIVGCNEMKRVKQ
jgi:hypothetical protein